ncbi:MAG: glutathione S-transferase family protein [Rhodospirillaceae bacterium]|nr:glutathione S-transferase family protein [Rhodospirillaceae bacterium]
MKLIGRNLSPFTRRVAVAMNLLGIPHERERLSPWSEAEAKSIRATNPLTRVPALVLDDGEIVFESGAILDHLMEGVPAEKALIPPAGAARRKCLRLMAIGSGVMDKGVAAFYERTKRPAEKVHQPWHDHLARQVTGGLEALEAEPMTPWYLGERISMADITAAVALTFVRKTSPALAAPGAYPKLDALAERCEALPAFQASPLETP